MSKQNTTSKRRRRRDRRERQEKTRMKGKRIGQRGICGSLEAPSVMDPAAHPIKRGKRGKKG